MSTSPDTKSKIIADLFFRTRNDPTWHDFRSDNALGLSIAWYVSVGFINIERDDLPVSTWLEWQEEMISTFDNLLAYLGILEDTGFDNLDTIMAVAA